jgi:hypothetical protein
MIHLRRLLALPAALLLAACADSGPQSPLAPSEARLSTASAPTLVECPTTTDSEGSALLGLLGGSVHVNGHRLDAPIGAVLSLLGFEAEVHPSPFLEVEFHARGLLTYHFSKPVRITIDYSRCPIENIDGKTLHVLYIDPNTKAILQDLGGIDDRPARKISTTTDHLSDYALGAN